MSFETSFAISIILGIAFGTAFVLIAVFDKNKNK